MNDTQGTVTARQESPGGKSGRATRGLLGKGLSLCAWTVHGALAPVRWLRIGVDEAIASGAELQEIFEHVLERRMIRALHALHIPTYHDVRELSARVAALQAEVAALELAEQRPGHSPRAPAKTVTHNPRKSRPAQAARTRTAAGAPGSARNGRRSG